MGYLRNIVTVGLRDIRFEGVKVFEEMAELKKGSVLSSVTKRNGALWHWESVGKRSESKLYMNLQCLTLRLPD